MNGGTGKLRLTPTLENLFDLVLLSGEMVWFLRGDVNIRSRTAVYKKRDNEIWMRERFLTELDGPDFWRQLLFKECALPHQEP